MKKILMLLLILIFAICMVACGNKEINESDNNLTQSDGNEEGIVENIVKQYIAEDKLNVFEESQSIEFEEDTALGYEWIYILENASVVSVVRDEFVSNTSGDVIEESKGKRICEMKGIAEGETIISFECINYLDSTKEPIDKVKFKVAVNSNNEIAIIEEIH